MYCIFIYIYTYIHIYIYMCVKIQIMLLIYPSMSTAGKMSVSRSCTSSQKVSKVMLSCSEAWLIFFGYGDMWTMWIQYIIVHVDIHIYIVNATAHNSPTSSTLGFISFLQKAYVSGDLLRSQRWVQDVPNHRQMHVCSLKQSIGKVWLRNKSDPGISGFTWISQIVTAFTQRCSHVKALADGSWIYQATSIGPTIVGKSHTCSHAQNGKFALGDISSYKHWPNHRWKKSHVFPCPKWKICFGASPHDNIA